MKKFFLPLLAAALLFTGCDSSSDSNDSDYVKVKLTIDGTSYDYYTEGFSNEPSSTGSGHDVLLMKDVDGEEDTNEIYFILEDDGNGMTKDFVGGTDDLDTFQYYNSNKNVYGGMYITTGSLTSEIKVTVTSWSSDEATMSFSGKIYDSYSDYVELSSESFTIPYVNYDK